MYEIMNNELSQIEGAIHTCNNERAWPAKAIPHILELALKNNWIVLGGEVITLAGKYTYDSWFYDPIRQYSLEDNVLRSISVCSEYISDYIREHGDSYYFSVSISNTYAGI